jgi:SWI/SNF-related matrix-associated actin-dependent regulator of chromatin subfamily D
MAGLCPFAPALPRIVAPPPAPSTCTDLSPPEPVERRRGERLKKMQANLRKLTGQMPPAGPHPQAHPNVINQQHIQQQREIQMQHQLAQRRSKKPTDRNLPEGIEKINPIIAELAGHYKALQEAERKLDMTMMRKRLDMQDTFNRHVRREQTLRIFINNTFENQPWQQTNLAPDSFDFETGEDATYKVKCFAQLLEDDDDSDNEDGVEEDETQKSRKQLFHFFKAVSVDVERPFGEPVNLVDWKKQPNTEVLNNFNMERKGDENLNLVISLTRDETPERYRLSQALSQTLDMEEGDRAEVLQGVWEYVKFMGLQEDEEKRKVRCDAALKQVSNVPLSQNATDFNRSSVSTLSTSLKSLSESSHIFTHCHQSSFDTPSAWIQSITGNTPSTMSELQLTIQFAPESTE